MTTTANVTIYIKRAEIYHTQEYITQALKNNNYGDVKTVRFINKNNHLGHKYNGAVVTIQLYMNNKVKTLFDNMANSPDGTARLYHNHTNNYWFVMEYKSEFPDLDDLNSISSDLSDSQRVKELEMLVKAMATKMQIMQTKLEKNETKFMEYEHEQTRQHIHNTELHFDINYKDIELGWKIDEIQDEHKELVSKINNQHIIQLNNKNKEIDTLTKQKNKLDVYVQDLKEDIRFEVNVNKYLMDLIANSDDIKLKNTIFY
jgi:hypothetical protein